METQVPIKQEPDQELQTTDTDEPIKYGIEDGFIGDNLEIKIKQEPLISLDGDQCDCRDCVNVKTESYDETFDCIKQEPVDNVDDQYSIETSDFPVNTKVESSVDVYITANYESDTTDICDKQVSSEHNILTSPCTSYSVETTPQIIQQTNHHDNVVTCKFCFNTFTSTSSLSDHINSLHKDGKYTCFQCEKKYSNRKGIEGAHRQCSQTDKT